MSGWYSRPKHGWTCFHCGETFKSHGEARTHFGFDPSRDPGCVVKTGAERGLLKALRAAERDAAEAWAMIHAESTEAATAYQAQASRHQRQLIAVEEMGYERGLRDGMSKNEGRATAKAEGR